MDIVLIVAGVIAALVIVTLAKAVRIVPLVPLTPPGTLRAQAPPFALQAQVCDKAVYFAWAEPFQACNAALHLVRV